MELFDSLNGVRTNPDKSAVLSKKAAKNGPSESEPLLDHSEVNSRNLNFGISAIIAASLATLTAVCLYLEQTLEQNVASRKMDNTIAIRLSQAIMIIAFVVFGLACASSQSEIPYLRLELKAVMILGLFLSFCMIRNTMFGDQSAETAVQPAQVIASFTSHYVDKLCKIQKRVLLSQGSSHSVTQCAQILASRNADLFGVLNATQFLLCYTFAVGIAIYLFKSLSSSSLKSRACQLLLLVVSLFCCKLGYESGSKFSQTMVARNNLILPQTTKLTDCQEMSKTPVGMYHCTLSFTSTSQKVAKQTQPAVVRIDAAGVDSSAPEDPRCHNLIGTAYLPKSGTLFSLSACTPLALPEPSSSPLPSPTHLAAQPQQPQPQPQTPSSKPPSNPPLPPLSPADQQQLTSLSTHQLNYLLLVFRDVLFAESSGAEHVLVGSDDRQAVSEVSRNVSIGGRMFVLDGRKYLQMSKASDPLIKLLTPADLSDIPKDAVEKISDAVAKQISAGSHSSLNFEDSELDKLDSLGYYRIVVNARKSPPLVKADDELAAKYTTSFGKEDWKNKIEFGENVLKQITDDGQWIDGVHYGYHHGIHRNAEDGAIVFNCVGKYNNASQSCDGRISGSVRKCHFSDDQKEAKICDTLIYLRDYGQGEGVLKKSLFSGEMIYPVPLSDYNTVRVNCTGKYDGFGCIGSLKFEIDIDKFNGYGTCEKGIYLHYCLGGLNMYYGNLGLGDAASSDVDGYQVLCEGIYNFKKRTCTKNYQKSSCVGDMLGNSKTFSCAGEFRQRKCDLLMIGQVCGPKKVVCSKMLTDGKCLSFESSTDELCKGYTVTNLDKSVDCVGKYKAQVTEKEVTNQIGECEGTMKIAKKQCDGKFTKENKAICNGLMTTQTLCQGTYEDKVDNIKVICNGKYLEKTDQCEGTQSLNFKSESTKICDGVSPFKTPDTCDGVISVSTRAKLYGANSFKGNLLVSRSKQKDSFSCKGVVMIYPHADKFFCSGDMRYTPDPTSSGKKFRCRIWDKDKCIPDNPHSKGVMTANV